VTGAFSEYLSLLLDLTEFNVGEALPLFKDLAAIEDAGDFLPKRKGESIALLS